MVNATLFVVPVDFAPDMEATVSAAFALAKACGTHVQLLEVVSPRTRSLLGGRSHDGFGRPITSQRDWSRLAASISAAERGGTHVRSVSYPGDPLTIIASYAQLKSARLLVMGKHYGTPRWRRNTGLVSTLSRAAPVPVLVLPVQQGVKRSAPLSFSRIVSAVDFTVSSAVAVRTVLDLIRRTGARLTLVHALENVPHPMTFSGGEALEVARTLRARETQVAARLRRTIPADVTVRVDARVTPGKPHRAILDVASEVKADLIVMGVPPRNRIDDALFGSTLRHVLRGAEASVLVVPVRTGAYAWLEETDETAWTPKTAARVKRPLEVK